MGIQQPEVTNFEDFDVRGAMLTLLTPKRRFENL